MEMLMIIKMVMYLVWAGVGITAIALMIYWVKMAKHYSSMQTEFMKDLFKTEEA